MSFLDLFSQAKPIVKPYRCLSCRGRFKLKPHAANHQRQAGNPRCRELGFELAEEKAPIIRRASHKFEDEMIDEEFNDFPGAGEEEKDLVRKMEDVVIPYGENDVKDDEELRKKRLSRKGSMKASALKIKRCLERMDEIAEAQKQLSQRTIARIVAEEYATLPRNCYT